MQDIANAFIQTLVELHALDYEAAGLYDLGQTGWLYQPAG